MCPTTLPATHAQRPELAEDPGGGEGDPVGEAPADGRERDPPEDLPRTGSERGGGLLLVGADLLEDRQDGAGDVGDARRTPSAMTIPGIEKMTWMPVRGQPAAEPAGPAVDEHEGQADHDRRDRDRQVDGGVEQAGPGEAVPGQHQGRDTPNTALSGTAITATIKVRTSACTNAGAGAPLGLARSCHAVPRPGAKAW